MRREGEPRRLPIDPGPRPQLAAPVPDGLHSQRLLSNLRPQVRGSIHGLELRHDGLLERRAVHAHVADRAAHAVDAAGPDEGLGGRTQ